MKVVVASVAMVSTMALDVKKSKTHGSIFQPCSSNASCDSDQNCNGEYGTGFGGGKYCLDKSGGCSMMW